MRIEQIHKRALTASRNYKNAEAELLEAIIEVRDYKAYRFIKCSSLYEYCVKILGLDPGVVYNFTAVAKKIKEVPELKYQIATRQINVSTARRITSVLTNENKAEWFAKAQTLSAQKLEKEVARVNPKFEVKERASYLSSRRVKLEVGLSEELMLDIRKIQNLESQRLRRSVDLELTLGSMARVYLQKLDPVEKAKRVTIRDGIPSTHKDEKSAIWQISSQGASNRKPIPAHVIHQVNLRDQRKCQFTYVDNQKCNSQRFIEIHHIKPVAENGNNEPENLITLCAEHHKQVHN